MITRYRGRADEHTMIVKDGQVEKHGRGMSCLVTKRRHVMAVPGAHLSAHLKFPARSFDMQPVEIEGDLTYRIVSPSRAATSFDFSVDPKTGTYLSGGPSSLRRAVVSIARDLARDEISRMNIDGVLGGEPAVGRAILVRMRHSPRLRELGVRPMDVFVKELRVSPEIARTIERRMMLAPMPSAAAGPGSDVSFAWRPQQERGAEAAGDDQSLGMECTDSCPFRHLCGDYMNEFKEGKAWCTLFREFST